MDYPDRVPFWDSVTVRDLELNSSMYIVQCALNLLLQNICLLSLVDTFSLQLASMTSTVTRKGPYFRDLVSVGTFGTFSEGGSLFVIQGPWTRRAPWT